MVKNPEVWHWSSYRVRIGLPIAGYLKQENGRNQAITKAYQSGGFTLAEIPAFFNLHYSTVMVIVRKSKSKT